MKRILADEFIGVYPVSKTLRFELKPIGKTLENIERDGIIDSDVARSEDYKQVKVLIDDYHKAFIQKVLEKVELQKLEDYYSYYNKSKRTEHEEKDFVACQKALRTQISEAFKKTPEFETINKKELITRDLVEFFAAEPEKIKLIESFSLFTTYFTGFHQNRQNMYSHEAKSSSIAYRIVHQNLPKFIDNIKIYQLAKENAISDQAQALEGKLQSIYPEFGNIEDYFSIEGFNRVISQKGIDLYNTILGGYNDESGEKIQGLNELVNLYNQKDKERYPKFKFLFKQILSDRESASYIPDRFENDKEVLDATGELCQKLTEDIFENEENLTIEKLFSGFSAYDLRGVYIKNDTCIATISQELYRDWARISNAIRRDYENNNPIRRMNQEKYDEKERTALKKVKSYPIAVLNSFMEKDYEDAAIEDYFVKKVGEALERIQKAYESFDGIEKEKYETGKNLKGNNTDILIIKNLLDSIKELQRIIKPLMAGEEEADKDETFYVELIRIWNALDIISPFYNKVRNYITGKPYSTEKIKLNFGKSTLLNGWDKNKERDNLGVILAREGNYYLGIMNRNNNGCFDNAPKAETETVYHKMNYKLLPGPNKMFPKVFFSKSRIDEFGPSEELLKKYKAGTHKKQADFNINDCHELIDFFKSSIKKHEDWSQFDFSFSDTCTYKDISEFYREVSQQGYKITFTEIDYSYIKKLVDEGKLYLFQIYNKDFSVFSKGVPNLHTLYWKALFLQENLADVVYKLNGEAEVFFRKASIRKEDIITHAAGTEIINKDPLNDKKNSLFEYDIVKDKRFTCDKFMFHVPITMNFKAEEERYLNTRVNRAIHDSEELHIIGVDRGERNLLYISVIDMDGNIVEQMSLNEIFSYDRDQKVHRRNYHQMLTNREKDNISSRQNWTTINTIKELKEGYLGQTIHVITELMIKYNAIVVLEDLNYGFKRGRQKFERQVYQKFEKMLIDKLNYYVDKHKDIKDNGGLMKAYQLTAKFSSFQTLGKQSGFLYYVPAWNTSKIDPTTGFTNLFTTRYESVEKTKAFISNFNKIWFDTDTGAFAFSFDYDRFTYKAEGTKTDWTIYSQGTRIEHFRNQQKNGEWDVRRVDLTEEFKKLFAFYCITIDGGDLKGGMLLVEEADFYKRFMKLISLTVQMRNSDEKLGIDEIISPVKNNKGEFFISGKEDKLPIDADANGAYNIAKKGLWIVRKIMRSTEEELGGIKLAMSNKEWLKFAQENTL